MTGTTDGEKVVIRAGTAAREVTPSGGAFSASIPLGARRQPDQRVRVQRRRRRHERVAQRVLALVRDARRRPQRPEQRRQRPGHVPLSDQRRLHPRHLRPRERRGLHRGRQRPLRHADPGRDHEPVRRRSDLAPADQRLPRLRRRLARRGDARHEHGRRVAVEPHGRDRRPVRAGRRVRAGRLEGLRRNDVLAGPDARDRADRAALVARRRRPAGRALRRGDVRQRRRRRGHRQRPAGL